MFLENATAMADAIDFAELSLEHQKECLTIITESSARAARDAIAFSDLEDVFAEAKRAHVNRERQDILNDSPTNNILSLKKGPNSKTTRKRKAMSWRSKLAKLRCLLLGPL